MTKRTYWSSPNLEVEPSWSDEMHLVRDKYNANLVSSLCNNGKHQPTLDIDLPCKLVESKTPGHYHLYIDHDLTFDQYKRLIDVMADIGLVGEGIRMQMENRGMTCLRTRPNEKKYVGGASPGPSGPNTAELVDYIYNLLQRKSPPVRRTATLEQVKSWVEKNYGLVVEAFSYLSANEAKRNLFNRFVESHR